ncbi:MAG: hypothetical protein N4J56_006228 [Chroococcidiopsis sp. SAG 2025]|nr:hypothetical protein [Chroococcidiopsis sp. SAG 2025]
MNSKYIYQDENSYSLSKPREVVQEVYGWLLGHWAVRLLMFQAAKSAGITPLRLSFTGTLRVIRRAIPKFQRLQSQELPFFKLVNCRDFRHSVT